MNLVEKHPEQAANLLMKLLELEGQGQAEKVL